jgi:hypothetical protein
MGESYGEGCAAVEADASKRESTISTLVLPQRFACRSSWPPIRKKEHSEVYCGVVPSSLSKDVQLLSTKVQ